MISWDELVFALTELGKLENGAGSEIEFEYNGKAYFIITYKNGVEVSCMPDPSNWSNYSTKRYTTLDELGRATDFGFQIAEVWDHIDYLECKPDFNDIGLEDILKAYQMALRDNKTKRKRGSESGKEENV